MEDGVVSIEVIFDTHKTKGAAVYFKRQERLMATLDSIKEFLRIDTDYDDALITSLLNSAVEYINVATGLTAEEQAAEPLCTTVQKFIVANWYENRNNGGDMAGNSTILSLLKTIKAKATYNETGGTENL